MTRNSVSVLAAATCAHSSRTRSSLDGGIATEQLRMPRSADLVDTVLAVGATEAALPDRMSWTGYRSTTVGIHVTAKRAVEHSSEGISTARLHPFGPAISSVNLLSLQRSQTLIGPLVLPFLRNIRARDSNRAGASLHEW